MSLQSMTKQTSYVARERGGERSAKTKGIHLKQTIYSSHCGYGTTKRAKVAYSSIAGMPFPQDQLTDSGHNGSCNSNDRSRGRLPVVP